MMSTCSSFYFSYKYKKNIYDLELLANENSTGSEFQTPYLPQEFVQQNDHPYVHVHTICIHLTVHLGSVNSQ